MKLSSQFVIRVVAVAASVSSVASVAQAGRWFDYTISSMYGPTYAYSPGYSTYYAPTWYAPGSTSYYAAPAVGNRCSPCATVCNPCSPCATCPGGVVCPGGSCPGGNCAVDGTNPSRPRPDGSVPRTFRENEVPMYDDSADEGVRRRGTDPASPATDDEAFDPESFESPATPGADSDSDRATRRPITGEDAEDESVIPQRKQPPTPDPERESPDVDDLPEVEPSDAGEKITWRSAPRRSRLRVKAVFGDPVLHRNRPATNAGWETVEPAKVAGK